MKIPSLVGVACIVAAPLALADNHASGNPEWSMGNPVEIYGCSFKDGVNGYEMSMKHAALVNAWGEVSEVFIKHLLNVSANLHITAIKAWCVCPTDLSRCAIRNTNSGPPLSWRAT